MFKIVNENINEFAPEYQDMINADEVGGIVFFQGVVRNHNDGHKVKSLEYDSYVEMANKVGLDIVNKAKEKFDIVNAICIHRIGHLAIGDTAVWVAVTAHHRKEAFEASQYIIDVVKGEVPIWKQEHYVDMPKKWIACHRCKEGANNHAHTHDHGHHSHS